MKATLQLKNIHSLQKSGVDLFTKRTSELKIFLRSIHTHTTPPTPTHKHTHTHARAHSILDLKCGRFFSHSYIRQIFKKADEFILYLLSQISLNRQFLPNELELDGIRNIYTQSHTLT